MSLTDRQRREVEYHKGHAAKYAERGLTPVDLTVATSGQRRWWNATWAAFDILRSMDLREKRVLIPGCGFGDDAARLAALGADVTAFDISPELIDIARARAERFGYAASFSSQPAEKTDYPDASFDLIWCRNILHHADIPATLSEFRRLLKPGGFLAGEELYTHGSVERVRRRSSLINRGLYPLMVKFVYGQSTPYITEDERKIDHYELRVLTDLGCRIEYYDFLVNRLLPDHFRLAAKVDRIAMASVGSLGRFLAGRIVFSGEIK